MPAEVFSMEARLKNLISKEVKTIVADLKKMDDESEKVFNEMDKHVGIVEKTFQSAKKSLISFAKQFGPAAVLTLALTSGVNEVRKAIDLVQVSTQTFEKTLSTAKATLRPTAKEFEDLSNKAKELGKDTVFTASQVGASFVEMGKLGQTANEIIASSAAVLDLAAIAGTGMANSAEVAIKTLNQFDLEAEETTRVVDVMALSFNSSALDMEKFSQAMKFAGSIGKETGEEIESITAVLSVFADRGIESTLAGTAVRRILLEIADSASKASVAIGKLDPTARSLSEKFKALKNAGIDITLATELFGDRAANAAVILAKNIDKVDELEEAYKNASGTAGEFAETMLNNVVGASMLLTSAQESLAIAIGDVFSDDKLNRVKFYTQLTLDAKDAVEAHKEELSAISKMMSTVVVGSIGAVADLIGNLIFVFDVFKKGIVDFRIVFAQFDLQFMNFVNRVTTLTTGKSLIDTDPTLEKLNILNEESQKIADSFESQWNKIRGIVSAGAGDTGIDQGILPGGGFDPRSPISGFGGGGKAGEEEKANDAEKNLRKQGQKALKFIQDLQTEQAKMAFEAGKRRIKAEQDVLKVIQADQEAAAKFTFELEAAQEKENQFALEKLVEAQVMFGLTMGEVKIGQWTSANESLQLQYDTELSLLDIRNQKELNMFAGTEEGKTDLARAQAIQRNGILAKQEDTKKNIIKLNAKAGLDIAVKNAHAIATENKKATTIYKTLAIAQATIDTYASANASYKAMSTIPIVGPALGFAAAALAVGAGLVNVANISKQSFQTGSDGPVGGNSFSGDQVNANLNSGEGVFTREQQGELFRMARGKGSSSAGSSNVTFQLNIGDNSTISDDNTDKIVGSLEALNESLVEADKGGYIDEFMGRIANRVSGG